MQTLPWIRKEDNTSESGGISGEDVVNYALQFVGGRYVGGESLTDGVDCSDLL